MNSKVEIENLEKYLLEEQEKWDSIYASMPPPSIDGTAEFFAPFNELVSKLIPKQASILEAGCGGGGQSLALAQTGLYDLTLMDFSNNALEYAKRYFEIEKVKANFLLEDVFKPTQQATYDLVFNAGVLEHYDFEKQILFVKSMKHRSKKYVVVLVPNRRCYWYWLWRQKMTERGEWQYGQEIPASDYSDVFEEAGLNFVGNFYFGERWTQDFINGYEGLSLEAKAEIIRLNKSSLLSNDVKSYLVGFVGAVKGVETNLELPTYCNKNAKIDDRLVSSLSDAIANQVRMQNELNKYTEKNDNDLFTSLEQVIVNLKKLHSIPKELAKVSLDVTGVIQQINNVEQETLAKISQFDLSALHQLTNDQNEILSYLLQQVDILSEDTSVSEKIDYGFTQAGQQLAEVGSNLSDLKLFFETLLEKHKLALHENSHELSSYIKSELSLLENQGLKNSKDTNDKVSILSDAVEQRYKNIVIQIKELNESLVKAYGSISETVQANLLHEMQEALSANVVERFDVVENALDALSNKFDPIVEFINKDKIEFGKQIQELQGEVMASHQKIDEMGTEKEELELKLESTQQRHIEEYDKLKAEFFKLREGYEKLQTENKKSSSEILAYREAYFSLKAAYQLLLGNIRHAIHPKNTKIGTFLKHWIAMRFGKMLDAKISVTDALLLVDEELNQKLTEDFSNLRPDVVSAKGDNFDVIVFPVIDWHFRVQRPQHLAREIASSGHRTFYLTTTFCDSLLPGYQVIESPAKNVFVVKINAMEPAPNIYSDKLTSEQVEFISEGINKLIADYRASSVVNIVDLPFWTPVCQNISRSLTVYDCMDHHAGFSTNSEEMLASEHRLMEVADLVITTSQLLSEKLSEKVDNVLIRNAGEIDFFAKQADSLAFSTERPVVGYYGAICNWFDIDLVVKSAKKFPQWDFVLVGSVTEIDISSAEKLGNIYFIGEVPYSELPKYLYSFDVCTIPFIINELTLCTNPVKVYEYMAAGKPVVATAMPELIAIEDVCHVGQDHDEYMSLLEKAMSESSDSQLKDRRAVWAKEHDWASRASLLTSAINEAFPKVSVIVLTYNNLDFTKACLHSIEQFTNYPNLELIIVDNASSDSSPEYLKEFAATRDNVKLILNEQNLGFSAGNNVGLRAATGEYVIILNNDTFVTEGWLYGLVSQLKKNPKIGIVGPVTNNIGNEAKIDIQYANMDEMHSVAASYTSKRQSKLLYVNTVAFFCVAMSRQTFEVVGEMDEDFGVGFFEDDDYCNRIRKEGLKVAIVENVFVHHHLSASFDALKQEVKKELFEKNKKIYEQKWGEWIPHKYRNQ